MRGSRSVAFSAVAVLAACGASEPPVRSDLTRGFSPARLERAPESRRFVPPNAVGREVTAEVASGAETRFSVRLGREDWSVFGRTGLHRARFGLRGYPREDASDYRLTCDGSELASVGLDGSLEDLELGAGEFCASRGWVYVELGEGRPPPLEARLVHSPDRGRRDGASWRITGRRFSGLGLPVWPGESLRVEVPRPGTLRFAAAAEPARYAGGGTDPQVVFRVAAEGETLFAHEARVSTSGVVSSHAVDLSGAFADRDPGTRGEPLVLELSVDGDLAYTSFLCPRLGPTGAASHEADRPDLVVFQADTFRADNLRVYGGELDLAPYVDELLAESLVFHAARSGASYTLPAHATMFSGLHPYQAGIDHAGRTMLEEVTTVAEVLRAAGYRTGAVTDSFFVSASRGLAQGFEWFDEWRRDMASTGERVSAFLDGDDGRPMFLFVQTYDVHAPYTVTPETARRWGDVLDLELTFEEVRERRVELGLPRRVEDMDEAEREAFEGLVDLLRDLYRAGVVDFGHRFEAFHRELEERGALDDAYLVFLSDHGESFLEHDDLFHRGPVWEEHVRIPFAIRGPGIAPGLDDTPVSLLDLAPTLAELAGVEPHRSWRGRSVLAPPADRPVLLFEAYDPEQATWARVEGSRKVIAHVAEPADGEEELLGAFDLEQDPGELRDVSGSAAWLDGMLERMRLDARSVFQPLAESRDAVLDAGAVERLRALGYVDE